MPIQISAGRLFVCMYAQGLNDVYSDVLCREVQAAQPWLEEALAEYDVLSEIVRDTR